MSVLDGEVVLVTGASRGLGYSVAQRLAAAGAKVAACARTRPDIDGVRGAAVDVRDAEAVRHWVDAVADELGTPFALVNNAGVGTYKPLVENSVEELDLVVDVNLKGVLYGCRAVLPHLLEAGRGHIVNVASDLARRPLANMVAYTATKHAVLGLSASLLREVKGQGIKVTVLNPGIIDTWFGGSEPGRPEEWALRPEAVADVLLSVLEQPGNLVLDEVTVHPLGQDF